MKEDLKERLAKATEKHNPANDLPGQVTERNRIPMSIPEQKLSVPDIPGFHMHWFLSVNVPRAMRAGYQFVEEDEVRINNFSLADDPSASGNTDLGSRVSVIAGRGVEFNGQPERLYLMKIKEEWWEQDQKALEDKNEHIADALRGGHAPGDVTESEHIPDWAPQRSRKNNNLFTRKRR